MRATPFADATSVRFARTVLKLSLPLLTLLVLAGCEDATAPTELMVPAGADELIADQNHNGGTAGFIWLSPVVKGAVASAPFNDALSPEVVICELDGTDCAETQSADFPLVFSGSDVTTHSDHYQALWNTKSPDVLPAPTTYRATVRVGLFELGFADFQFGSTGGEVKNLTTDDIIGLKDGRTMPLNFTITTDFLDGPCTVGLDCKIAVVGPGESLTITRDGDAAIYIPAGTLPVNATVVIEEKVGAACELGTDLPWYNSCYTYDIVDADGMDVEFNPNTFVIVEQCLDEGSVPAIRVPEVQLGAQHADIGAGETSDFELLPSDDTPATLSCDDYVPGPNPTGVVAMFRDVKRGIEDLFLGRPLHALDKGLGGRARDLSTVAYVDPGLRVASFDLSRGGFSSIESAALAPAKASLQAMTDPLSYNTLWIDVGSELTHELLDSHVDVAIIGVVQGNTGPITPLTADEQEALEHYVLDGGCAILLADNSTFGSAAAAQAANASLVTPFGLSSAETLGGERYPTIVAAGSPLIDGLFGTVTSINQYVPGGFDSWGTGTVVAEHRSDLAAVVEIASYTDGVIDGGPVLAFSDANMFFASGAAGRFHNNETLFRNTIAACATEPLNLPVIE